MKCNNFLCPKHDPFNKLSEQNCVRDDIKDFVKVCEARKRYNRIMKNFAYNDTLITCDRLYEERNKYYGRK